MTRERYQALHDFFAEHDRARKALAGINTGLTRLVYVLYFVLLIRLLLAGDSRLLQCVIVPGSGFIILSIIRDRLNCQRPYEVYDIPPSMAKRTKGHSFPSRHAFSVFIIAIAWGYITTPIGAVLILAGIGMCIARVVLGVHFVKDVIVGAIAGLGFGIAGFLIF